MTILGISLGTRLCGAAILNQRELICWNTHTFQGAWSNKKADAIYETYKGYIINHKIKRIAVKLPPSRTYSKGIIEVLKRFATLFEYHGCMVQYNTQESIKQVIPDIKNTRSLVEYVLNDYPMLIHEKIIELANKRQYHTKMFEAVLVAHIANNQQVRTKK
jgi:RNase H-fold protein (predicted Holliday junction resolvase)